MTGDDLQALRRFRAGRFVCCTRRRDALLEVLDAVLTAGTGPSLPHLRLAAGHRRGWGSVYAALRRGHLSSEALRSLLLRQPMPDGPPLSAVDVSVWPRPGGTTSPERGYQYHSPRRRDGRDPVVPGWAYQWLTRLSWDRDRWTAPVDVRRVRPAEKPTDLAVEQLKTLVATRPAAQRGEVPLVRFDAGYDAGGFTRALAGTPVALLIRRRSNRHFWFAPARTTAPPRGRPKRHGAKFVCDFATTRPPGPPRPPSSTAPTRPTAGCRCGPGRASTPTCGAPCGRGWSGSTAAPGGSPTAPGCAWRSAASPAGGAPRMGSGCGGRPRRRRAASRAGLPPQPWTASGGGTAGEPIWSRPSDS